MNTKETKIKKIFAKSAFSGFLIDKRMLFFIDPSFFPPLPLFVLTDRKQIAVDKQANGEKKKQSTTDHSGGGVVVVL